MKKEKMKLNWSKLLSKRRPFDNLDPSNEDDADHLKRTAFERDYGRVLFSKSFRRLGKKTQVHPLAKNDHIHNRLTHTLEVTSVGQTLGLAAGKWLKGIDQLPASFTPEDVAKIVEVACLCHDLGNPPFGHAGEFVMRAWFTEKLKNDKTGIEKRLGLCASDLKFYEGNAHSFRIVSKTEIKQDGGLRLTCASLGSIVKYPWFCKNRGGSDKIGFYESERREAEYVFKELGLKFNGRYLRHPLSYLMEAADDICYKVMDIEDAIEMNLISVEDAKSMMRPIISTKRDLGISPSDTFEKHRALAINALVYAAFDAFTENYEAIMSSRQPKALLKICNGELIKSLNEVKEQTSDKIFSHERKVRLELGSYGTIDAILKPLLNLSKKLYLGRQLGFYDTRLLELMDWPELHEGDSRENALKKLTGSMRKNPEAFMRVMDFIGGMTDNYAVGVATDMSGLAYD